MKKTIIGLTAILMACNTPTITEPKPEVETDTVYVYQDTLKVYADYSFTLFLSQVIYQENEKWGVAAFGKVFNEGYNDLQLTPNLKLYKGIENFDESKEFSDNYGTLGNANEVSPVLLDSTETLPAFESLYHLTFSDTLNWDDSNIYYRFRFKQNSLNKTINKTIEGKIK